MSAANDRYEDPELEAFLHQAAPAPTARFEAELERKLFARTQPASGWLRLRSAGGAIAAVGGLAAVLLTASLVGGGPLASDGGDEATARPGCQTVYVTEVQPVGEVVRKADGTVTVETSRKPVSRQAERCR